MGCPQHPSRSLQPAASGQEQGSEDAGQQEVAGGRPGGSGGAVAQVGVTAVDADPRQLLLLAVTGGGTAAGQQDAQDHCKARTGHQGRGQGGGDAVPAWGLQGWVLGGEQRLQQPPSPGGGLTALCFNAEPVLEALVGLGAGDHLGVGAPHVHVFGANHDVAAITLQSRH